MTKDVKQKLHPALIAVLAALGILLLVRFLPVSISFEPTSVDKTSPGEVVPLPPPTATPTAPPLAIASDPITEGAIGSLRVSNQTKHPIRVALLAKSAPGESTPYAQPAHWDFSPEEGREKGLVLSLPEKELQLYLGDILVAFAQDGSQRYWGPYVVGQTKAPGWNAKVAEWQLVLRP
ncbi:MAG: hypothetical protein KME11_21775 [Timaviella obliquedivisa GSE-PSE-MK23-08B]|jgi:hypothetical protein|nr:hypothetical protein [Timaviella obliquedivisa GSE-PSE-MK23-08B]